MAALWTEASLPPEDEDENVLHIGGIFPIGGEGGWQGGQVRMINSSFISESRKLRILRGSDVTLIELDHDCLEIFNIF